MNNENLRPNPNISGEVKVGAKKAGTTMHLRKWWKEEFLNMTEKEIDKYIKDKKNPYLFRVFCRMWKEGADIEQYYKLANQCYGNPREEIEVRGLPEISLEMFEGGDDEDKPEDS